MKKNKRTNSKKAPPVGEAMERALEAVKDELGTLNRVWVDRATCTLEVAATVEAIRNILQRFWTAFCGLGMFPFGKREADMYVSIGRIIVRPLSKEMIERLPKSLSPLYSLSLLDRAILEKYIESGAVTPKTTGPAAQALLRKLNGSESEQPLHVERRLKKFASFVADTVERWTAEQLGSASAELNRIVTQIQEHAAPKTA